MRGHVYRRGQTWTVVHDEPAHDGRRRQRSKGGFRTKRDAEAYLADQLARLDAGGYTAPAKLTVGDYLDREWLPAAEATLRPGSVKRYGEIVRRHIVPGVGGVRLQQLTGAHLTALYRRLERDGLSAASRKLVHAVIHRSLRDAVRWGRLQRNPADMADAPRQGRSRAQAWTARELGRFLEHVADDRLFALWRLAATTGMRRGELAGLTWRALDLERGRLRVEQQLLETGRFGPPKSERSRRTVALDPDTVDALRRHRDTQLLERDFAGGAYRDRDLVFCDELGGPLRLKRLTAWFVERRKLAGIPTGTLHTLRHTAATLALTNGVPVHIVAARLGDDPKVVLSTYAHLLPQADELAAERVAAALQAI